MNEDEPHVDFSSSIINFRLRPPVARGGTPRPPRGFSAEGEIRNLLSNIHTATENATLSELLDISDNVIWNATLSDSQRTANAFRSFGSDDASANLLQLPMALRTLLGSLDAGPHIDGIINRSLHDKAGYKLVLSEEGAESLNNKKYSAESCGNDTCPITRGTFDIGANIVELPCGHCFDPEAINRWLNEEKAECPVCRHALKSKEIKSEYAPPTNPDEADIRSARIALLNSLASANNIIHPFGPRLPPIIQRRASLIVSNEDNAEMQEAILRSLRNN